jgi:hypothetical protein
MTYQKITGTLNPGAHPGSYNGQDAYNDMLVVSDVLERNRHSRHANEQKCGGGVNECQISRTSIV